MTEFRRLDMTVREAIQDTADLLRIDADEAPIEIWRLANYGGNAIHSTLPSATARAELSAALRASAGGDGDMDHLRSRQCS